MSCYYANDIHNKTMVVNIAESTEPSYELIEQDSDSTLLNFKCEMLALPNDKQIPINDALYMHFSGNKKLIIGKNDIFCAEYCKDLGEVSHLKILRKSPQRLYGTAGKHPGIPKMMRQFLRKYYFPSIATYVRNWVLKCAIRLQDKRKNNTQFTPEIIHIPEWDHGPKDLMRSDLLQELPPSGGYENIITAIDVFSR